MTAEPTGIEAASSGGSRRQFLARATAATGLVWVTPTATTLDRAFAAGSGCPPVFSDSIQSEQPRGRIAETVGGFTITSGNVDVVGPGFFPELVPTGYTNGVDLDGESSAGSVLTSPLIGAGTYIVRATLSGDRKDNSNNQATVVLGLGSETRSLTSDQGPETVTFEATLATPSALTITHDSGAPDNFGMLLLSATVTPKDCAA